MNSSSFRKLFLASALLAVLPSYVHAELIECNGVWTNKDCSGPATDTMKEVERAPRSQADIDLDRKKLLLHHLDMKRLDASSRFGVEIGISAESSFCNSVETTLAECDRAVQRKSAYIDDRMVAMAQVQSQQSKGQEVGPGHAPGDSTVVTIIQDDAWDDDDWRWRRPRPPHHPGHHPSQLPSGSRNPHDVMAPDWNNPNRPRSPFMQPPVRPQQQAPIMNERGTRASIRQGR